MADRIHLSAQRTMTDMEHRVTRSIRQACFTIGHYFGVCVFMFGTSFNSQQGDGGDADHVGSIYYHDEDSSIGSLDVIAADEGSVLIVPGIFQDDSPTQNVHSKVPSDFHSFPRRLDYIDIPSDYRNAVQREYHNSDSSDSPEDNTTRESSSDDPSPSGNPRTYLRKTMDDVSEMITARHDPCTPDMKTIEQRMRTFSGWRLNGKRDAESTAKAGFFYSGRHDQAECYHCSLRIYDWVEEPIVEHIRWSPRCHFLRDNYTLDYIYGILFNRKDFVM